MKSYTITEIREYFRGWNSAESPDEFTTGSVWNGFQQLECERDGIAVVTVRVRGARLDELNRRFDKLLDETSDEELIQFFEERGVRWRLFLLKHPKPKLKLSRWKL